MKNLVFKFKLYILVYGAVDSANLVEGLRNTVDTTDLDDVNNVSMIVFDTIYAED